MFLDITAASGSLFQSFTILWVNEIVQISNLECTLVILKACPLVVDCSFSMIKKSTGSVLSNPLNIKKTSSKTARSRLVSRAVIFNRLGYYKCLKSGIIPVALL